MTTHHSSDAPLPGRGELFADPAARAVWAAALTLSIADNDLPECRLVGAAEQPAIGAESELQG